MSGTSGLIGSIINTAANVGMGIYNRQREDQNNINNRHHAMQMQNFMTAQNRANAISVMQYNDPKEQRARLESAGVNPFTAIDNLNAGDGQLPTSANVAPAQAQFTPVNIDFSSVADALMKLDEMKFTKGENEKSRMLTERQLWATLANASEIQRNQISAQKEMQMAEMQHQRRSQMVDEVIKQDYQNREHEFVRAMKDYDFQLEENRSPYVDTPYFKGTLDQFKNFIQKDLLSILEEMFSGKKYEDDKKQAKNIWQMIKGLVDFIN